MAIKIILADDHYVVRDGIKAVIERKAKDIAIVGESDNGRDFLKLAEKTEADVFILDIGMPVLNGLETAERLLKKKKDAKIIIFSLYDENRLVEKAVKIGIKGYVLKENATEELIQAIRELDKGNCFLSPSITKYLVQEVMCGGRGNGREKDTVVRLTKAERGVLQLIAEGNSNKNVAAQLNLSVCTVRTHRSNIMKKLDLHKQADLIRYALKEGITQLEYSSIEIKDSE